MLGPNLAVLLGQVAMGIARKVRQERRDFGLCDAVAHARHITGVRLGGIAKLFAGPQRMVGTHPIAIGHALLHITNVFVREHKAIRHDPAQVKDESCDGIHFFGAQGFRLGPGHGTRDVIPQG